MKRRWVFLFLIIVLVFTAVIFNCNQDDGTDDETILVPSNVTVDIPAGI
jgi:hypothetical protein